MPYPNQLRTSKPAASPRFPHPPLAISQPIHHFLGHLGPPISCSSPSPPSKTRIDWIFSLGSLLPRFGFRLILAHLLHHPTTLLPSVMSSTNSSPNHHSSKRQAKNHSSRTTRRTNPSKDVLLHHPMSSPPPDDWVLFSQDIVTETNSNVRHAPLSRRTKFATTCLQTLPLPDGHVTELKATTPAMTAIRFPRKPYKPSNCLNHMSARNCTAACVNTRPPPPPMNIGVPPKAPSPPRLPTPELPEIEEDDSWSCCMFSESNESGKSTQTNDDFWNENGRLHGH